MNALPPEPPSTTRTPPSDAPAAAPRRVPSRGWYGLAFVLLLVGLAAYIASLNVGRARAAALVEAFRTVTAPGEAVVTLDEPGPYTVFYEKVGTRGGERFDLREKFPVLPKMNLTLTDPTTGREVAHQPVDSHAVYRTAGREGYSEWAFELDRPATLRVHTELVDADPGGQRFQLAFGKLPVEQMTGDWRGVFGGAALLAFAFVVSSVTIIVTWMLRHGGATRRDA